MSNNIQNSVSSTVRSLGVPYGQNGACRNVYVIARLSDFFAVGSSLFSQGFTLYSPADYAKKSGVSRQMVDHWLMREGVRIAIKFERKGKNLLFVVE